MLQWPAVSDRATNGRASAAAVLGNTLTVAFRNGAPSELRTVPRNTSVGASWARALGGANATNAAAISAARNGRAGVRMARPVERRQLNAAGSRATSQRRWTHTGPGRFVFRAG